MNRVQSLGKAVVLALLAVALTGILRAQEPERENNPKALRYFQVLQKRPSPGYLFDRFYNAWLDTSTLADLEGFLKDTVKTDGKTENRLLLAFYYVKQGENVRALEQFKEALEKDPGSADAWYQKALVEQRTLNFDNAIQDLERALSAKPKTDLARDILQLQGRLYARNGNPDKAKEVWQKLLKENASDEDLQEDLIELQMSEGLYDDALATAEALLAVTKDPYLAVLRQLKIGDIHQRSGKRDLALEAYNTALAKVGNGTWIEKEIFAQIDQVFRREDDIAGLKDHFVKLKDTSAGRIGIQRKLVDILAELGEKDAATAAFSEILKLTPGDRAIREDYVDTLAKMELTEKAAEQLEALIALHPEDGELLIKLAGLQHSSEKPTEAGATVQRYLEASDKSEYAHLRAARLLEQYELKDAAEEMHKKLGTAFPDSEGARDAYASFLHRTDRKEEAVAIWLKGAEQANREQMVRVARTLMSRNETEAAFNLLQSRYEEFKADPVYLTQLCTAALQLKKIEEAVPWARRLVELADQPLDLENAVGLAAKIIAGSEQETALKTELAASKLPQEICLLAELHERASESTEAEAALATIEATAPELALAQLISLYRQRRDYESAAAAAVRLVESPGGRRTANVQKVVELYQNSGNVDKALEWLPEWKKLSPGSTASWLTEARLLAEIGKNSKAIDTLRRASQQFEGNEDVRSALARMYGDEGKLADATRMYMQLYEEAKDTSSKLRWVQQLASTAEMQGKSDALLEQFEERRRGNRSSLVPLLALAEIHRVSNNYEGRRQSLMEATRVKPKDIDLLLEIARIEESEADYDKALETLKRALEIEDSNRIKERISQLHFAAGDDDAGFQVLRDMAGKNIDAPAAEQLAMAIIHTGDWEYAIEFLLPMVDKFPDDYRIGYLHAIALEESGKEQAALTAFGNLLSIDQEPATARALTPQQQQMLQYRQNRNSYQQTLKEIGPPDLETVVMANQYSYQAYTHRQQRSSSYRAQRTPINMPIDLDMLKGLSIAHILTMARLGDEEIMAAAKEATKSNGVSLPPFLFEYNARNGSPIALIEDYPEDDTLLALVLLNAGNGQGIDPEILDKGIERFGEKHPQLAFGATIAKASIAEDDEEAKQMITDAMEFAKTVEKPNYFIINAIVSATGVNNGRTSTLTEETSQQLIDLLLEWYGRLEAKDPYRNQLFHTVTIALSKQEDLSAFVAFLDQTISEYDPSTQAGAAGRVYPGNSRNQPVMAPLPFPPVALPDFPVQVLSMLGDPNNHYYARQIQLDPEQLEPATAKAKSPVLRLLLTGRLDLEGEKTPKLIEELLNTPEPKLATFLLAAGHAAKVEESPEKAVTILKRAKYLPMTRALRQTIDSALLAWAIDLQDTKDNEVALAEGREAALRLRRATLNPQQRLQLVGAMEQLGLTNEAKTLEKKLAASPSIGRGMSSSGMHFGGSSRYRPQSQSQVEKFVSEGKREQALKILVNDLRGFAQSGLSAQNSNNNSHYESRWTAQVTGYGLTKELLERINPGTATGFQKRAHWAFANEVLGEAETAITIYRELLESRPKEDGLRARLFSLMLEKDPSAAATLLEAVPLTTFHIIFNNVSNLLRNNTLPFKQRMETARQIADTIMKRDDGKTVPNWLPQLADTVARVQNGNNVSVAYLYRPDDPGYDIHNYDESQHKEIAEMLKLRRETHDYVCNLMLSRPEHCRDGFRRLSGLMVRDGKSDEEIYSLAVAAIKNFGQPKGVGMPMNQPFFYQNNDSNSISTWLPGQFVVRHAFITGKPELVEEAVPLLEAKQPRRFGKQAAKELRDFAKLYFCDESAFLAEAEAMFKANSRTNPQLAVASLLRIIDTQEVRKLQIDLAPLVFKQLKALQAQGSNGNTIVTKMAKLKRAQSADALVQFLDAYASVYLGPEDKREELVKKNYKSNGWSSGTINGGIHVYLEYINSMARTPELFYQVYDHAEKVIAPLFGQERMNNISPYHHPLHQRAAYRSFETQVEILRESPIVAEARNVRFYGTFAANVGSNISGLQEKERKRYITFLQSLKTIGADFVAAIALSQSNSKESAMTEWFNNHHVAISKLREQERTQLRAYIKQNSGSRSINKEKLSEDAAAVFVALNEQNDSALLKEIDELLAAKSIRDLTIQQHSLDDKGRTYLRSLLPKERGKAGLVYWKIVELMHKAQKSGGSHTSYGGGRSFAGHLLENTFERKPERLNFLFDILSTPPTESRRSPSGPEGPDEYAMNYSLRIIVSGQRENGNTTSDSDLLRKTLPELASILDQKYWRYAIHPYFGYVAEITGSNAKRLADLLPAIEAETKDGEYKELARELLFVAKMREATFRAGKLEEDSISEEISHAMELLADDKIPKTVRLDIASALVARCGKILPLSAHASAMAIVDEMATERHQISGQQFQKLLAGLMAAKPSEERDAIITTAIAAWKKAYFSVRAAQNSQTPPAAQEIVNLAAIGGDIETINAVMNRLQGRVNLNGSWFLSLLRNAPAEQVNRLLLKGWMNLDWRNAGSDAKYDEGIDTKLEALLGVVENPDFKFFAEALVLSMPDKEKPEDDSDKQEEPSPRDKRLTELADRVKGVTFKNPMVRDAVFAFIGESDLAAETIREQIIAAAESINPLTWHASGNSLPQAQRTVKQKLFERKMRYLLEQEPERVVEIFDLLAGGRTRNNDYQKQQAIGEFLESINKVYEQDRRDWSEDQKKKNTQIWAHYLRSETINGSIRYSGVTAVARAWLYDILDGDGVAAARFAEDVSPQAEQRFKNYGFEGRLFNELPNILKRANYSLETRTILAKAFCNFKPMLEKMKKSDSTRYTRMFSNFVSSKLFTEEEMMIVGEELATLEPRGGHAFAELAGYFERASKLQPALKFCDAALTAAKPSEDGMHSPFLLTKVNLVYKDKGAKDAFAIIKDMEVDKVAERERTTFLRNKMRYSVESLLVSENEGEAVIAAINSLRDEPDRELSYDDYSRLAYGLQLIADDNLERKEFTRAAAFAKTAACAGVLARDANKKASTNVFTRPLSSMEKAAAELGTLPASMPLIDKGSEWFYLDNGSSPQEEWQTTKVDSATGWKQGKAKLGYGDENCVTIVDFGDDEDNKHLVTYFQKTFTRSAGEEFANLTLYILRDDGAIIYLDGKEISRQNLPKGDVTDQTKASRTVSGTNEEYYYEVTIDQKLVSEGAHTLAVQLHQSTLGSSDLGFDLALIANEPSLTDVFSSMSFEEVAATIGDAAWDRLPDSLKTVDAASIETTQ